MLELIVDFLDFYEFVYTKPVFTAEAALVCSSPLFLSLEVCLSVCL